MQFFFNWHSQKCCTSQDYIWVRSASSYNWEQNDRLSTNYPACYVILFMISNSVWTLSWTDQKLSRVINLLTSRRIWFSLKLSCSESELEFKCNQSVRYRLIPLLKWSMASHGAIPAFNTEAGLFYLPNDWWQKNETGSGNVLRKFF